MSRIEIIAPTESRALATELSSALLAEGFSVLGNEVSSVNYDPVALTIGIVEPPSSEVYFELGHRLGAAQSVLLVADRNARLPEKMNQACWISRRDPDVAGRVISKVREMLGIELPSNEAVTDFKSFVQWLAHDWSRLYSLDSRSFERLVLLFFEDAGFETQVDNSLGRADIIVKAPNSDVSWLVECRSSSSEQPLGLGAIRDAYSLCSARGLRFSYLLSNSYFTRPAADWASRLVPPLHLVDCEQLKAALVSVAKRSAGNKDVDFLSAPRLLRINKQLHEAVAQRTHGRLWTSPSSNTLEPKRRNELDICFVMTEPHLKDIEGKIEEIRHRLGHSGIKTLALKPGSMIPVYDWPEILKKCRDVVILLDLDAGKDQKKLLKLVALSFDKMTDRSQRCFIVGHDDPIQRLSMPGCLSEAFFVDTQAKSWAHQLEHKLKNNPVITGHDNTES